MENWLWKRLWICRKEDFRKNRPSSHRNCLNKIWIIDSIVKQFLASYLQDAQRSSVSDPPRQYHRHHDYHQQHHQFLERLNKILYFCRKSSALPHISTPNSNRLLVKLSCHTISVPGRKQNEYKRRQYFARFPYELPLIPFELVAICSKSFF
jgi:hypothetical protein